VPDFGRETDRWLSFTFEDNKAGKLRTTQQQGALVQTFLQCKIRKSYIFWVCVYSLSITYPASNAHAPYFHLWPALIYSISPHYLKNGTIFKKVMEHKTCFFFFFSFYIKIFHFKKNWARYNKECILNFMYPLFSSGFNQTWIFGADFSKKWSNIKFHENPSSGGRVIPCARTDRHDEANSCFFCILRQRPQMRGAIFHLHLTSS
jgi:hypothetical protein